MRHFFVSLVLLFPLISFSADYSNKDCDDIYDPLEKVNRKVFMVNGVLDHLLLRPVAKGYNNLMPGGARAKIGNFIDNLYTPVTFVNNILQLDFKEAMKSFWKFTFNSTFGILGFNDLTSKRGLNVKKQSFGSTLAYYGVRPGPYVVLPFYGSTNLRDMFDVLILDRALNPIVYNIHDDAYKTITVVSIIHKRGVILPFTDNVVKTSADPYVTIRSVLHQKREAELNYPESRKCIREIE
jgi:phospholipid-binding lipoprotein MlaA